MTFLHPLPWWLLTALAAGIVAWALLAAGGSLSELRRGQRAILASVRVAVVLLLVAILMRPVVMGTPPGGSHATIAVLVDASRSMGLADAGTTSRLDRAVTLAREAIAPALRARFAVRLFTFGERLQALGDEEAPVAEAPVANFEGAMLALPSAVGRDRLAGAVVLSDGGMTVFSTDRAERIGVPVLTVGVGAVDGFRDREVLDVSMGDAPFAESTAELSATVVSRGLSDQALDVVVLADDVPVATRRVDVSDGAQARVTAEVRPAADRPVRFTVRLAAADGELTADNNEASVLAPPARRRALVLLVEGAPGFEHSFLKRALERDPALAVDAIVPKGRNDRGDPTFYVQASADRAEALVDGWPKDRGALFAYDAVVLANASLRGLSRDRLDQLTEFVAHRGGGLLAIGADTADADMVRGALFADVLPLDPAGRGSVVDLASHAVRRPGAVWLTPAGEVHPVMHLAGESADVGAKWAALPPLSASPVAGTPRPGASVLAMVAGPSGEPQPLVTVQRYGRGWVLSFTGEASWRWRMMLPSTDLSYDTFWRQAIRWVAAPSPGTTEVSVFDTPAATAEVVVALNDARYEPVPDAIVPVRVFGPSGVAAELLARPDPERPGRYLASFDARSAGVYRVVVEPRRRGTAVGHGEAWMLAGAIDREMRDPRRNDAVLSRVAQASGGRLAAPSELRSLATFFGTRATDGARQAPVDLWHNVWVFGALLALLCLEWALRRRWGLR